MPISLPTPELSWRFQLQTRITFASLLQVTGDTIYTIITRLISEGWTCKGSCDGTTGAMDGVNRITAGNKFQTRFSGVAGTQSWIVLTDGDGANIVYSFNSAADDRVNFWWSPTGSVVVNGTNATFEPTATDQDRITAFFTNIFFSMIGTTAAGDRLISIWTTADRKNYRVAIARAGTWQSLHGKEGFSPATLGVGVTLHPGVAWCIPGDNFIGNSTSWRGLLEQCNVATAAASDQFRVKGYRTDGGGAALECVRSSMLYGTFGSGGTDPSLVGGSTPGLQGGASYVLRRLGLYSAVAPNDGNMGKLRDWYYGHLVASGGAGSGTTYGALQWIVVNGAANTFGITWPWDGATAVVMT